MKNIFIFFLLAISVTANIIAQTQIQGKIVDSKNQTLPGANITVIGTQIGTTSQADGSYQLRLNAGIYELRVSLVGYKTVKEEITIAQENIIKDFSLAEDLIGTDEVIVVGTRSNERTVVDAPVPVDVLSAAEIKQSGLTETSQIIQMLSSSFNFPRPAIMDGTDHTRPATLRGLGPDQVLVLINGKRRHTSAMLNVNATVGRGTVGVDFNAIPANAIERIEILRDGAAAQYGSDAIAGVINIILKSDYKTTFSSSVGQTGEGDGLTVEVNGNHGMELGDGGYVNFSGMVKSRAATNRAGNDKRQQYFADSAGVKAIIGAENPNLDDRTIGDVDPITGEPTILPTGWTLDAKESTFNRNSFRFGDPKTQEFGVFMNGSLPTDGVTVYSFGGFTYRKGESGGFYRPSLDKRNVRAIYPDGFLPLIFSTIVDGSFALGAKGDVGGWLWDLSAQYGTNSFRFDIKNSLNASYGVNSPTEFYAGSVGFNQTTANIDILKTFDIGSFSPLNFATGLEFRIDNYVQKAGEDASWKNGGVPILDGPHVGEPAAAGSQVFPGYKPSDASNESRNNIAFYIDLENKPIEQLLVSVAGRAENYSDFGSTIDGKLAVRIEPISGFSIRGAASTGFRAPSMVQQYYSSTSTDFPGGNPVDIGTFPVSSDPAKELGATSLKAEKSVNISAGIGIQPIDNFSVTVDYYNVDVKDRIILSENFGGESDTAITNTYLLKYGVGAARFFTNAIDTKTSGWDFVLHYALNLNESGILRFTGSYNMTENKITRISEPPTQLAGLSLFGELEQKRLEKGQPKDNINLSLNYTIDKFAVTLRETRYGSVFEPYNYDIAEFDQTFSAKWLTDIDVSYTFFEKLRVAVGGSNIFNVYPDKFILVPYDFFNGLSLPYSVYSPFGFTGAYYYTKLSVEL